MTYQGNTEGPTSIGNGTVPIGTVIIDNMSATSEFNIKNLKNRDGELVLLKFTLDEGQRLEVGERLDKTTTSKYLVEYRVLFKVHTSTGETITASQYYYFRETMDFDDNVFLWNPSYLKTTYRR
jgi:hypothetical protein